MKRKQFKSAVTTAFGRHKTRGGSTSNAGKGTRKGETFRKVRAHDSANSQQLLRLQAQKKRLTRAIEKIDVSDQLGHVKVHVEACHIFDVPAREGFEFAEDERLWHLRQIVENYEHLPEAEKWRPKLVVALLAAGEVDDARIVLRESDASTATELAYSAALLAFIDACNRNKGSSTDSEGMVDASVSADIDQSAVDDQPLCDTVRLQDDVLLNDALRTAIGTNPYVADILGTLDTFTVITTPQQLDGARKADAGVAYAGSVEEALVYVADAGMMWADRPGMEDWVRDGISKHGTSASSTDPRSCFAKNRYKKLFIDNVAKAKEMNRSATEDIQE